MKSSIRLFLIFALCMSSAFCQRAAAQSTKGAVAGKVTDNSGSVLQGAEIELQPGSITTASGTQGAYFINNLNPGTYTISITYVGFSLFTKVVIVAAGQTTSINAKMEVSSQRDQVLVTAERVSGEAEQLNRQRTADNILQVLSNEVITSLPNANIADAVGRLPSVTLERDEGEGKYVQVRGTEPRLTNATIDGVNIPSPESRVRNIKLDAVPSDIVERIEVYKTLSADQDADGIGGTVNLVTKTTWERPFYALGGTGGYNPIQNGYGRGGFSGTFGQRFGVSKKFAFLLNGTFDKTNRGIDDLEPGQATGVDPATRRNVAFAN